MFIVNLWNLYWLGNATHTQSAIAVPALLLMLLLLLLGISVNF